MGEVKHKSNCASNWTILIPLLTGLLTAQVIATCFVYFSNQRIYELAVAATNAGYFPIPAGPVLATLKMIQTAFGGGLFFTLSIGALLSLASWSAVRLLPFFPKKRSILLTLYIAVWLCLLVAVNTEGVVFFSSMFVLLIPLATAGAAIKMITIGQQKRKYLQMLPVIILVLLTALWTTQLNKNLFISIRDRLLLSNPLGRTVNDFYYRYTLYAAETFKSLKQKTLRTYRWEKTTDPNMVQCMAKRLIRHDMLQLPAFTRPDLTLSMDDGQLVLKSAIGSSLKTTPEKLMADPNSWIQKLSNASDRYAPLRRVTLVGLLLGFPILLFVAVYGFLSAVLRLFLAPGGTILAASALCLIIGISLFLPMMNAHPIQISAENIGSALTAEHRDHRLAALRYIQNHKLEIGRYPQYQQLLTSPHVVERYWLARAMAQSRMPSTYNHLMSLLKDPHPNVLCQAYFALGRRGNRAAINPIKEQLAASDHWYSQWYGYRALRNLGWRQKQSN